LEVDGRKVQVVFAVVVPDVIRTAAQEHLAPRLAAINVQWREWRSDGTSGPKISGLVSALARAVQEATPPAGDLEEAVETLDEGARRAGAQLYGSPGTLARVAAVFGTPPGDEAANMGALVIINAILTFMLTPGKWIETHYWLDGFFNPTYWPSLALRLVIMFGIAGMYSLVTSARIKEEDLRVKMLRYSAKWLLPLFVVGPIVAFWYFKNVPQFAIDTIFTGIHASGSGNFSILARSLYLSAILSGTVLIFAFVGPYLNPKGFSFRAAILFFACGLMVTGITEWTRELLRKPYIVYDYIYSNNIRKDQIPAINQAGYLTSVKWAGAHAESLPSQDRGSLIFRYQCMSCHTESGYRSMKKLVGERDQESIVAFLNLLHETDAKKNPYIGIMPPFAGNDRDIADLSAYLATLNHTKASQ
jgi:mono/diheme cytochrome c family protein